MGNKRCVVSFADGAGDYRRKMERLKASITTPGVDFLGFTSYEQIGCEPHSVIPYQFKPYAIEKAIELGYESILWCDSPIVQVKDLRPVFEHIEKHGYVFFDNIGHPLGKWTNDKCLAHFEITREDAMDIKMIMACCMGFSLKNASVWVLLQEYANLSEELYPGSWDNHRHDQSVMSCLLATRFEESKRKDYEILNGQQTFFMYEQHRFAVPINEETICLISK